MVSKDGEYGLPCRTVGWLLLPFKGIVRPPSFTHGHCNLRELINVQLLLLIGEKKRGVVILLNVVIVPLQEVVSLTDN